MPKNSKPSCLNDYRPVALTSTVMKVFERLLKNHICSSIPATLDPLQFAYRPNRATDDAISQVLHSSLTHTAKKRNYVRLLFIDYSSAFNTIVPIKLAVKLTNLGLNSSLCDWIQDFLTCRPQVVKMGQFTSNSITLNIGAPQGCVLSPLLYSLYTHDCVSSHSSTYIVKICWWYCGSGPHFQQWWDRILGWGRETYIMVPGQLSFFEHELIGHQEETAAAIHSSYDQWDPCGEGEQLQVPRCKHLR